MTSRKKKEPKAPDGNTLKVQAEPGKSRAEQLAKLAVRPSMTATMVALSFSKVFGEEAALDATAMHDALLERVKRVRDGDMHGVEATLVAQAAALNCIFTDLARRSAVNAGEYMGAMETYMKLALRAQNQCRMTLETLATIKNPPVVFAKQANIAHGHQQVNNGEAVPVARAGENGKAQPELLEAPHAKPEWMDAGAAGTATQSDPAMETVGAIDRAAHKGRQGHVKP